jgi:hypothetical protein
VTISASRRGSRHAGAAEVARERQRSMKAGN